MTKILIIEDELQIRENLQEILEAQGFDVLAAENGAVGLDMATASPVPDLILCDVMMPELDGYGVLESLRQRPLTATIPVIFLTAKADRSSLRQGMIAGADDYLTKPFSRDELLQAIAVQLAKQASHEQRTQMKMHRLCHNIAYAFPRELLAPLKDILGMSELLIDDHGMIEPAEALEIAEMIHNSGQSLHRLVQNFLVYTNLELINHDVEQVKQFRSHRNRSLTKDIITEAALLQAVDSGRTNDLHLEVQDCIVYIGEFDLKKVVEEVVSNAFKFSEAGTTVRLTGTIVDENYHLYISDQGRGMTSAQINEIGAYAQFNRRVYEQKGCGLGLAIAKRIVELYGGELVIESTPDQYTTVCVTFLGKPLYTKVQLPELSTI